jgi:hypothetical protein
MINDFFPFFFQSVFQAFLNSYLQAKQLGMRLFEMLILRLKI